MTCSKCGSELHEDALYCHRCGRAVNYAPARRKRGNGTGTAYRRGDTWTAQITDYHYVDKDGKVHRKYRTKGGFRTKRDALAYCAVLKGSDARKVPTLLDLYTVWEETDLPLLSKDKQSAYRKARERIEPIIGKKIDLLTTADLQNCINDNAFSYYTARDMKTLLSHLYNRAAADRFVPSNLTQYITLPKLDEKEQNPFMVEEVQKMWTAFMNGDLFVGYLLLMIYSGMMPGELFACRKDMINFDRCEIYGCGKKSRKKLVIVFADAVKPVIRTLCESTASDRIYPHDEKMFYRAYHEATERIGVRDLPPYSCRHTTGTEAAKLNMNAPTIQKMMRHSKITTTQKYIHLETDEAHDAMNKIIPMTNK